MATAPADHVALVTGATRGIGEALALLLAEQGMQVYIAGRVGADAEAAAARIRRDSGFEQVHALLLDVTRVDSVSRAFADIQRRSGRLDILVNNAAIAIDRGRPASMQDISKVMATLDANIVGAWRCICDALPLMRGHGYGRIVNVSSHLASLARGTDISPAYMVSKAALNALTVTLAAEFAKNGENIKVNSASPGTADTRMAYNPGQPSARVAAQRLLWLTQLADDGPSGRFFYGSEELPW